MIRDPEPEEPVEPGGSSPAGRGDAGLLRANTEPAGHGVVVLRWPGEREQLDSLARAGVPRLLLVPPEGEPPEGDDCLQDWIRLPCDTRDVDTRLATVSRRALRHPARPVVDEHGRLHYRSSWTSLSPLEARITEALAERFGEVVSDSVLASRAWGRHRASGNALRVQLTRIRRRVAPLGLEVRVVYRRGHLMQAADKT